jgi:hypothetical protein
VQPLDKLLGAISELARTSGRATSSGPAFDVAFPPLRIEAFDEEERRLGFRLPLLLKRLYTEVGNGGFGPGHGLISMLPQTEFDRPISFYYSRLCGRAGRSNNEWPKCVVPFCQWGDFVLSCLDARCQQPDPPVLRFEPNMSREDTLEVLNGKPFLCTGLIPESEKLSEWLGDWVAGREMFVRPY